LLAAGRVAALVASAGPNLFVTEEAVSMVDAAADVGRGGVWFEWYLSLVRRRRRVVLGAWLCALVVSVVIGPRFMRLGK
jgi:hypothetical protein